MRPYRLMAVLGVMAWFYFGTRIWVGSGVLLEIIGDLPPDLPVAVFWIVGVVTFLLFTVACAMVLVLLHRIYEWVMGAE